MKKLDLLPASAGNPRNSEGSMLELKDGRILFVYTHFDGGILDNASAYLAARYSADQGDTWTETDEIVVANEDEVWGLMRVTLLDGEELYRREA